MAAGMLPLPAGVEVTGAIEPGFESILTGEALDFVAGLERKFGARRRELLGRRTELQAKIDGGWRPDFLAETRSVRDGDWKVATLPKDLLDRRVEITGPVDRKMVINALNCAANAYRADFEDASTPTWKNLIEGRINLRDAIAGTIAFDDPGTGKHYRLDPKTAVLKVRPRGWHLPERHVRVDGSEIAGAFLDFGLFFFH